jgi:hypothetical protein
MVAVIEVAMDIEIGHVVVTVEIEFEAEVFDIVFFTQFQECGFL